MKASVKQQLHDLNHQYRTALTDYQNLQRRCEMERKDLVDFANADLITKLLTVLDHLKTACDHQPNDGLTIAVNEFQKILADEGLTEISALGQDFNPATMEAIELVKGDKDKVVAVVTKGYALKGRLLRPAKVQVGNGK